MNKSFFPIILIIISLAALYLSSKYEVGKDDQVVITQFGQIVGEAKTVPGDFFKIPFLQKAHYFPKSPFQVIATNIIRSKDLKYLEIKSTIRWRISDPVVYMNVFSKYDSAKSFVLDSVKGSLYRIITTYTLSELVDSNAKLEPFQGKSVTHEVIEKIKQVEIPSFDAFGLDLKYLSIECSYPTKGAK